MWIIISGYLTSIFFEYLIIELFKKKLLYKKLAFFEVVFGWLFQEYIKQNFNITSGKYFILKQDFRNFFITQIVLIIKNFLFWIHIINIFELGTFILCISNLLMVIYYGYNLNEKLKSVQYVNFRTFDFFKNNSKNILILIYFLLLLKFYSHLDFFLIMKLCTLHLYILCIIISFFIVFYLLHYQIVLLIYYKLSYFLTIFIFKSYFYTIFILLLNYFMITNIINENLQSENVCKELLLKIVFFSLSI